MSHAHSATCNRSQIGTIKPQSSARLGPLRPPHALPPPISPAPFAQHIGVVKGEQASRSCRLAGLAGLRATWPATRTIACIGRGLHSRAQRAQRPPRCARTRAAPGPARRASAFARLRVLPGAAASHGTHGRPTHRVPLLDFKSLSVASRAASRAAACVVDHIVLDVSHRQGVLALKIKPVNKGDVPSRPFALFHVFKEMSFEFS